MTTPPDSAPENPSEFQTMRNEFSKLIEQYEEGRGYMNQHEFAGTLALCAMQYVRARHPAPPAQPPAQGKDGGGV